MNEDQNIVVVEEKKGLSKGAKIGLAVAGGAIVAGIVGAIVKHVRKSNDECYETEDCETEE